MKHCIPTLTLISFTFALAACDRKTEVATPGGGTTTVETPSPAKQQIAGNWNQIKGNLKQQYADLTDDDLLYVEGKEEELYGRLQEKTGKNRAEVEKMIEDAREARETPTALETPATADPATTPLETPESP